MIVMIRESPLGERDGLDKFCESFGARLAADLRNGLFFLASTFD